MIITRTDVPPSLDGKIENIWYKSRVHSGFIQINPYFGQKPLFDTKVYLLYDNSAIYIAAIMLDNHPDSILKQLGNRDQNQINADYFCVAFDPYNKQQDAYWFGVYASGTQFDRRTQDNSYNAVWQSCVAITDTGWVVEIKIPYSAIRFPKKDVQEWRIQLIRYIRRNRQESRFIAEPREANNPLLYWAPVNGLEQIKAPLRLSLTPYTTTGLQTETGSKPSFLISGGTDLKYGINESFTLDVTLLPDFSQVQSDDKYKNLTAYETIYEEQRPFFKESVELFNKGDIFYSRRIGKTPRRFYLINQYLDSNEFVRENPSQTQLINAFKISGRNKYGLALGLLNAVTSNMYAIIENNEGKTSKLLTEPWANYNIFIIDKALSRGNNFFFTNTNYFTYNEPNSNVCASGLTLTDKKNMWQASLSSGTSIFYNLGNDNIHLRFSKQGYKGTFAINKINGKLKLGIQSSIMDKNFDANHVGLTLYNNYLSNNAYITFQTFEPNKSLLNYGMRVSLTHEYHLSSMNIQNSIISYSYWHTTHQYTSFWTNLSTNIFNGYDYDEPRLSGYFFRKGILNKANIGISTDYRKTLALDVSASLQYNSTHKSTEYYIEVSPLGRLSDHFSFRYKTEYTRGQNQLGFAAIDNNLMKPIFGKRNVSTIVNSLIGNYFFKNDLSLSLRIRHYLSQGKYFDTYYLKEDGTISESISEIFAPSLYHFYFQNLSIDFVFSWQFAPGSNFIIIWKNEIFSEGNLVYSRLIEHLNHLDNYPQKNTLLLKVLYYLDYEYLLKRGKK